MSEPLMLAGVFLGGVVLHEAAHAVMAKLFGVANAVGIIYKPGWKALLVAGPAILTDTAGERFTARRLAIALAPLLWFPFGVATAHLQLKIASAMLGVAFLFTLVSDIPALAIGGLNTEQDINVWRLYEFRNKGWRA
jgi:hypothetical protein